MAVLPILLIFMLQIGFDQRNAYIVNQIESIVYAAKEEAKQDGYFTEENISSMKRDLARAASIDEESISFESSGGIKTRYAASKEERLIYYKVGVPMKNVMAGASFFGFSDAENSYVYTIDSYTASERI